MSQSLPLVKMCHLDLMNSFLIYFVAFPDPAVESASERNEYRGFVLGHIGGGCLGLATVSP